MSAPAVGNLYSNHLGRSFFLIWIFNSSYCINGRDTAWSFQLKLGSLTGVSPIGRAGPSPPRIAGARACAAVRIL